MDRWRVILHLDLDAFYCQVEHKRLGIDRNVPLAVQQWAGLIAVNYPARANGVGRFCDINEAKTACPNLKLVHVETIGNTKGGKVGAVEANKGTSKASLARYRRASFEVRSSLSLSFDRSIDRMRQTLTQTLTLTCPELPPSPPHTHTQPLLPTGHQCDEAVL